MLMKTYLFFGATCTRGTVSTVNCLLVEDFVFVTDLAPWFCYIDILCVALYNIGTIKVEFVQDCELSRKTS